MFSERYIDSLGRLIIKIDRYKWVLESRYVWEWYNGFIPTSYIIHHIDKNPLNNDILNLELMTREEHNQLHNPDNAIWASLNWKDIYFEDYIKNNLSTRAIALKYKIPKHRTVLRYFEKYGYKTRKPIIFDIIQIKAIYKEYKEKHFRIS